MVWLHRSPSQWGREGFKWGLPLPPLRRQEWGGGSAPCTDEKENQIVLIYKEIQNAGSCKVKYEDGLLNTEYEEMRKYLIIYEEAVTRWSYMTAPTSPF
jgi:hypothetical protein